MRMRKLFSFLKMIRLEGVGKQGVRNDSSISQLGALTQSVEGCNQQTRVTTGLRIRVTIFWKTCHFTNYFELKNKQILNMYQLQSEEHCMNSSSHFLFIGNILKLCILSLKIYKKL